MYKWLWVLIFANSLYAADDHQRGEQLYRLGDRNKHITACIACHGPQGRGNKEAGFPILAKQHAKYTVLQLQAFKNGLRKEDASGVMHAITSNMSLQDMQALADYIEQLK